MLCSSIHLFIYFPFNVYAFYFETKNLQRGYMSGQIPRAMDNGVTNMVPHTVQGGV
jgi:hypothetical protein